MIMKYFYKCYDRSCFEISLIIYVREWLPIILGPEATADFSLDVWESSEYKPNLSPNIFNAFATAAFRLSIQNKIPWKLR